jgi:hypothetical protein
MNGSGSGLISPPPKNSKSVEPYNLHNRSSDPGSGVLVKFSTFEKNVRGVP